MTAVWLSELERGADFYRLYVLRCGPYFKIGISQDSKRRLAKMQTDNPFKIHFLMSRRVPFRQARFVERDVHEQLKEWQHRGEWFCAPFPVIKKAVAKSVAKVPGRERERQAREDALWIQERAHDENMGASCRSHACGRQDNEAAGELND